MSNAVTRDLYVAHGFFWNQHLAELVAEYGGREMPYPHPRTKEAMIARFFPSKMIFMGRRYSAYELTVKFLGEEIAPVGDCNDKHILLFLTESGKLIGFADYLLLKWGPEDSDWRASLRALLEGSEAVDIGVIE